MIIIWHCFKSSVVTTYAFAQKAQIQLAQNILYSLIIGSEIFSEFVAKLRITNLKMEIEGPEKNGQDNSTSRKACRNKCRVSTGKASS